MRQYRSLLIAVSVGLLASAVILGQRWALETRSRTVEVVIDGAD